MKRRLLASVVLVMVTLQVFSFSEASEPTKQAVIDQSQFKPFIFEEQVKPEPTIIIVIGIPKTEPTPLITPKPTIKPTPKPIIKPKSIKPVALKLTIRHREFPAGTDAARQYALGRIGKYQFSCLDMLFHRESGWRVAALNKSSGAYGIPQALPGSKMAAAGSDWRTNATTQVKWGLMYISGRYGSACNALRHLYNYGWY